MLPKIQRNRSTKKHKSNRKQKTRGGGVIPYFFYKSLLAYESLNAFYEIQSAKIIPENVSIEDFKTDCSTNKLKVTELMSKYNLSLYQVRELRIAYDVKTK